VHDVLFLICMLHCITAFFNFVKQFSLVLSVSLSLCYGLVPEIKH